MLYYSHIRKFSYVRKILHFGFHSQQEVFINYVKAQKCYFDTLDYVIGMVILLWYVVESIHNSGFMSSNLQFEIDEANFRQY